MVSSGNGGSRSPTPLSWSRKTGERNNPFLLISNITHPQFDAIDIKSIASSAYYQRRFHSLKIRVSETNRRMMVRFKSNTIISKDMINKKMGVPWFQNQRSGVGLK
jgi:hypothetical protein